MKYGNSEEAVSFSGPSRIGIKSDVMENQSGDANSPRILLSDNALTDQ